MDAYLTIEVFHKLKKLLKLYQQEELFYNYSMPLLHFLATVQEHGIKQDEELRTSLLVENKEKIKLLTEELLSEVGKPLNINSPKQVMDYFYKELGLRPQFNRRTKRPTVDEDALIAIRMKYPQLKAPQLIIEQRGLEKLCSTYLETPLKDGRFHCFFDVNGTAWTRLSTTQTQDGFGGNLQNLPREGGIRKCFIPDDDMILLEVDQVQAEAMFVAWDSGDEELKKAFRERADIHKLTASGIFGVAPEAVNPKQRYLGKRVRHAKNYDMGAETLRRLILRDFPELVVSRAQAQSFLDADDKAHPRIREWHERIKSIYQRENEIKLPFCFSFRFTDRWGPDLWRKLYACRPQGTVGAITNKVILSLPSTFLANRILTQSHDAILFQIDQNELPDAINLLNALFRTPIHFENDEILYIPVEFKIGKNWGEMKDAPKIEQLAEELS